MLTTPHFHCAASVAFQAASYHRTSLTRIAGIWIVRVLS